MHVFGRHLLPVFALMGVLAATAALGQTVGAEKWTEGQSRWTGSEVVYGFNSTVLTLNKSAEPYYDPTVLHHLALKPQWHFGERLSLDGYFDFWQELTTSDDTTSRNEVVISDPRVDLKVDVWEDPWARIGVIAGFRVAPGLSQTSRAETRTLAAGPALGLERQFPILQGLKLRYLARFTYHFNRFTTMQNQTPSISACGDAQDPSCTEFIQSGQRNVEYDLSHVPSIEFSPHQRLTISAYLYLTYGFLAPLAPASAPVGNVPLDSRADQDVRHSSWFLLEAKAQLFDPLAISLGAATYSPDLLGPDGTRRSPFFNRYTRLFVDLTFNL